MYYISWQFFAYSKHNRRKSFRDELSNLSIRKQLHDSETAAGQAKFHKILGCQKMHEYVNWSYMYANIAFHSGFICDYIVEHKLPEKGQKNRRAELAHWLIFWQIANHLHLSIAPWISWIYPTPLDSALHTWLQLLRASHWQI